MKVLVTGAAGYIGSNVAQYLLGKGYQVVGLDNFNTYYSPKIKEFNISEFKDHPNFKLARIDLTDTKAVENLFAEEKFDAVIHLAAWADVTYSVKNPHIYATENFVVTSDLADISVKNNIKAFVFASTSSVYGNNNTVPFKEDMNTDYPAAPYPASKKACEVLLYTYNLNFGLNTIIFRFFNPIGIRVRPDSATGKLFRAAEFGNEFLLYQSAKDSSRDYTYIGNMCEAMEKAINTQLGYEIFNLGNADPVTLMDLLKNVELVTGKKINTREEFRPGQMTTTCADISKAKNMLGYNPSVDLPGMIRIYYEWFQKQPDWYRKGEF